MPDRPNITTKLDADLTATIKWHISPTVYIELPADEAVSVGNAMVRKGREIRKESAVRKRMKGGKRC